MESANINHKALELSVFFSIMMMTWLQNLLCIIVVSEIPLIKSNQLLVEKMVQSDKYLPNIYNALLYILEFCQNDHDNVMISIDPNRINLKWLQDLQSTVILSNLSHPLGNSYYSFANKIDAYVIIRESTSSNRHLKDDFSFLWLFIREVIMPIYVLNIQIDGCKKPEDVLQEMWQWKITSPYYLCFDTDEKIKIYTFNSFIDKVPENWKRITQGKSLGFIPYIRVYTKDICKDLYFDRLNIVDGNRLTFAIVPYFEHFATYGVTDDVNDWYRTSGSPKTLIKHIMDVISKALNINYQIYITTSKESDQYKSTLYYTFMDDILINSSADLIMETESMSNMEFTDSVHKNYDLTYPLSISEWSIITRHRGYKTPEEKIRDFYGHWIFLFTLFVILTAFIVIWFTENRRTAFTIFEVLRLLISQGLFTRMNTLSMRIFFSMILIYFLVIKATFDGHLAKFLTKPELRKQVDTLADIKDLGYRSQYPNYQAYKCVDYILHNDSTVACINDRVIFYRLLHIHKNLYLGKPFDSAYYQLIGNRMSPFMYRIKRAFILFNDLGFQNLWIDIIINRTDRYKDKVAETRLYRDFQPITLSSLTFAFVILGIGLVGAVMSFCIEIYLK